MPIYMYGYVGSEYDGMDSKTIRNKISMFDPDEPIDVYINSNGGDLWAGISIMQMLSRHGGKVTAYVDGIAASAATVIILGADEVVMPENTMLMVHNPMAFSSGDYRDMERTAKTLEKARDVMVAAYKSKTGKTEDELKAILDEETWMTASEAVDHGFADTVSGEVPEAHMEQRLGTINFEEFEQAPENLVAVAKIGRRKIAAMAASNQQGAENMPKSKAETQGPAAAPQTPTSKDVESQIETPDLDGARAEGQAAITSLSEKVTALCDRVKLKPESSLEILSKVATGKVTTMEAAQDLVIDAQAANSPTPNYTGINGSITMGVDSRDKFKEAAVDAILMRGGAKEHDTKNDMRRFSLRRMSEECVVRAGGRPAGDDRTMLAQSLNIMAISGGHSTSDFGDILQDVMHKRMLAGYNEEMETWSQWTRTGSLQDFRPESLVSLTLFDSLDKVDELGEYQYGTIGDRGEKIQAGKYGKLLRISYETFKNDNLRALVALPAKMGRAAARVPGDLAYAVLTGNPTMNEDSKALFHADHNNTTNGSFSVDTVVDMRVAMRQQRIKGQALGIRPKFLIVPVALEDDARQVIAAEYEDADLQPNRIRGGFEVVGEDRLDIDSTTKFYMAADPMSHDTVEVAFMDGNQSPRLEQKEGWNVDATEFKVGIECAAAAADFRGLQRGADGN